MFMCTCAFKHLLLHEPVLNSNSNSHSSFSGSHNREAFSSLHTLALRLSAISRRSLGGLAGRATVEMAVGVVALALCVVMAGSGDLVSRV